MGDRGGQAKITIVTEQVVQKQMAQSAHILVIKEDMSMKIAESAISMSSNRKTFSVNQFKITRNVRMKKSEYDASKKKEVGLLDALSGEAEAWVPYST